MTRDFSLSSRSTGRTVAAVFGVLLLVWAGYTGFTDAIPELKVYDGLWMLLGAFCGVALVAPFIWRWSRQASLAAVALASVVGSWVPLVISAIRLHIPVWARFKGAWALAGADVVGPALPVAFVLLWLALREHQSPPT